MISGINFLSVYFQRCTKAWTGQRCDQNVDLCASRPCKNRGSCYEINGDYLCSCEGGWTGKNCTINIDDCAVNPCQNNGTCIDLVAKYECRCKDGYTGII